MIDTLGIDTTRPVYLPDPINRSHPLCRGLVSKWLCLPGLDGGNKWYDLMGLNTGTLTAMTTSASGWRGTTRPGGYGHLLFDGVDDYVILSNSLVGLTGTASATVSLWATNTTTGVYCLMSDNNKSTSTLDREGIAIFNNGGTFWARFNCGGVDVTASGGTWAVNTWYRVTASYDGVNVRIYANGVLQGTTAGSGVIFTSGANLRIGERGNYGVGGGGPWWFPGAIDDCSIWNRALSAAEVKADYDLSRLAYPGVLNRLSPAFAGSSALFSAAYFRLLQQNIGAS